MKPMTEDQAGKIPADVYAKLDMSLRSLEQALLAADPLMPKHLQETHRLLLTYPETVHLLDDEEIGKIVAGLEKHTNTQIVKEAAKGKSGGKRTKVDVNDL